MQNYEKRGKLCKFADGFNSIYDMNCGFLYKS